MELTVATLAAALTSAMAKGLPPESPVLVGVMRLKADETDDTLKPMLIATNRLGLNLPYDRPEEGVVIAAAFTGEALSGIGVSVAADERDRLVAAWPDILEALPRLARARLVAGRFLSFDGREAVCAMPSQSSIDAAQGYVAMAQDVAADVLGKPEFRLALVLDGSLG